MSDPIRFPAPAALVAVILLSAGTASAVSVQDLVHDTPAVRKRYQMDLAGFSTEVSPEAFGARRADTAEQLWALRQNYRDLGEWEKADAQVQAIAAWRLGRAISGLTSFGALLVRDGLRESDSGNPERAATSIEQALVLAPDYPPAHLAQGYLSLRRGVPGVFGFLQGLIGSVSAVVREPGHMVTALGRASGALALSVAVWACAWSLSLTLRYAGHLRHDVQEYLSGGRRYYSGARRVITLLALAGTVSVFLSPLWLAAVLAFLSWTYQGRRERVVSVVAVVLVAALPLLAWLFASSLGFLGDGVNQALLAIRTGTETAGQAATLEAAHRDAPGDEAVVFSLAQHRWRAGETARAEELYGKVRDAGGSLAAAASVNVGNMALSRGDLDAAAEAYRKAIATTPGSASAHYNLGQVLNLQFKFEEGEAELSRAQALDREMVSVRASAPGDDPQKAVLTEPLPREQLTRRIFGRRRRPLPEVWPLALSGVPPRVFPVGMALLAVLGAVYAHQIVRRGPTRRCSKCGRPFCPLCIPGSAKTVVCPQCQHIFVVKEGIDSSIRVEKMMEIRGHQQRRARLGVVLAAILPGGGHVWFGRPLAGAFLAAAAALLAPFAVGWTGPFVDRTWLVFPWDAAFARFWLGVLAAVWLASLGDAWRIARRET